MSPLFHHRSLDSLSFDDLSDGSRARLYELRTTARQVILRVARAKDQAALNSRLQAIESDFKKRRERDTAAFRGLKDVIAALEADIENLAQYLHNRSPIFGV